MDKEIYTLETYQILDIQSYRLKDSNDIYWYPLTLFLKKFLFRTGESKRYRDNPLYEPYMKVITYLNPDSTSSCPTKTWFVNTEGMFLILSNIKIMQGKDSNTIFLKKCEYISAAQDFFGVVSNIADIFISYMPDISNYDVWSILCIKYDYNINKKTIWKKCNKCGFYYPNTKDYFISSNKYLSKECKQCRGKDFVCKNKKMQYLYQHNGFDLLYHFYLNNDKKIIEEFKKWII